MRNLDRYIGREVILGYLMVAGLLLVLFSFLVFLEQLEDVGDKQYRVADALLYVVLTMPDRLLALAPMVVLIGGVVGLAALSRHSELIAIRAAGVSVPRIGFSVVRPSIGFGALCLVLAQYGAPTLYQKAEQHRARKVSAVREGDVLKGKGFWSRQGRNYVNIRRLRAGQVPTGIDIYRFSEDGRLIEFMSAARAEVNKDGSWKLINVRRKQGTDDGIRISRLKHYMWKPFWKEQPFQLASAPVASLSITDLLSYRAYLDSVGSPSAGVELRLWQKVLLPFSIFSMALLSASFSFSHQRSASAGRQVVLGTLVGIGLFLLSQILYNAGLVADLAPILVAAAPVLLVMAVAVFFQLRVASRQG
jgi:lipopolysaccharide export system permease protein